MEPFRNVLNPLLVGLVGERRDEDCAYTGLTLYWTVILHVLMQIAYTLWQVFDTGVFSRLSDGCRKPSQEMWAKMLFVAILVLGFASVPRVAPGAMRMRLHAGTPRASCPTIWNLCSRPPPIRELQAK